MGSANPVIYEDGKIVFYDIAFATPEKMINFVVHELAHHYHETSGRSLFSKYKKEMGWKDEVTLRIGPFVSSNAEASPSEDFASNFETYVLDAQKLETKVPMAFRWMKKNLGNSYKLKDCR